MTLQTLADREEQFARGILGEALLRQLPRPLVPGHETDPESEAVISAVLAEARSTLSLPGDDESLPAKDRLARFISSELNTLAAPVSMRAVKERLGERGRLRPKDYSLELRGQPRLAAKADHIRSVLNHPDAVQHLSPDQFGRHGYGVSLYAKWINGRKRADPFMVLVPSRRTGTKQTADTVLRVYPSEVDLRDAITPLDVLKRFLDVYGLPFTVDDEASPRLLLVYERVKERSDGRPNLSSYGFDASLSQDFFMIFRINPDKTMDLSLVFVLNLTKYRETLKRHGAT
jgi:hypothetical protein